jgi:hypothetical protein
MRDVAFWVAVAVGAVSGAVLAVTVVTAGVQGVRDRRRYVRQAVDEAEQMLAWEAEGHLHLTYAVGWHQGHSAAWQRMSGYWPQVAALAEQMSRDGRHGLRPYDKVTVSHVLPGGGSVREVTWAAGRLVSDESRPSPRS